jgi:hypothetical protein
MPAFKLIRAVELEQLTAALKGYGWHEKNFSVAEEEYDPATAEVEAETGEVIITCTLTHRVGVYQPWPRILLGDRFRGRFAGWKVRQVGACARIALQGGASP